jgi:hypothetical protein
VNTVLSVAVLVALATLPVLLDVAVRLLRRRVRRRRWIGIPEVLVDEPIRAVKRARLRASPDGRSATLSGLTLGGRYAVEDDARCPRECSLPTGGCDCGFYAIRPEVEEQIFGSSERLLRATTVRLDVELSGTVLEYELGYRAQHQRVLRVTVPRICASCARFHDLQQAVALLPIPVGLWQPSVSVLSRSSHEGRESWPTLEPVCDLHRRARADVPATGLADLAGLLGTEVTWEPSELTGQQTAGW